MNLNSGLTLVKCRFQCRKTSERLEICSVSRYRYRASEKSGKSNSVFSSKRGVIYVKFREISGKVFGDKQIREKYQNIFHFKRVDTTEKVKNVDGESRKTSKSQGKAREFRV